MTSLLDEALETLIQQTYNDTVTISDAIIISEYHEVLMKLIKKRIDEYFKQQQEIINDKTDFGCGYFQGLYDAKMEMLK